VGCGICGLVGCPCQAAHHRVSSRPKDSLRLRLGWGLASRPAAGPAPRAAQQGCSGEPASVGCPTTRAGTSGRADSSLAGRAVSALLRLLRGCSGRDRSARGPFCAGTPAPPKGACSPEQWCRGGSPLLTLSGGKIPLFLAKHCSSLQPLLCRGRAGC